MTLQAIAKSFRSILIPSKLMRRKVCIRKLMQIHRTTIFDVILHGHIVMYSSKGNRKNEYVRQMGKIMSMIKIDMDNYYLYPYDAWFYREIPSGYKAICSITVDFSEVLNSDIRDIRNKLESCKNKEFSKGHLSLLESIEVLCKRITRELGRRHSSRSKELLEFFPKMIYRKPISLDEAIQKLLFFDALFWQANHWHIGLGRLDEILSEYYVNDIKSGVLNEEQAIKLLRCMLEVLGKDTKTKSKTILGDTGQYILIGGINQKGQTGNPLTSIFLDLFNGYKHTDPKLILRVNKNTSDEVWSKAINCVMQGNGSPLFMNEEPIIKNMNEFGYESKDLYNVGTSACWEPLVIGKSFDQNNTFVPIMAYKPLNEVVKTGFEYSDFHSLLNDYKKRLSDHICSVIYDMKYDCSPLFTLFFHDCIKSEKDFTQGGAKYAFHGAQVLSFPNTINALLNIKEKVFDKHLLTLSQCRDAIIGNFEGCSDIEALLKTGNLKYGSCNPIVVNLANDLMTFIGDEVAKHKMNGEAVKVGFSSPNYIMSCKNTEATLDGRRAGEPFAVHISPISSNIDISEILDFATKLNYDGNRINGNIVDFTIPQSYIKQPEKLKSLIKNACYNGLFELQLNVLSYSQLVEAKAHPEKYPSLIVRVWGFSAYFNDLPEIYKDNLIERARLYETA